MSTEKEEVIYINLDAGGGVKDVYAVNIFGSGDVTDYSEYSSVRMLNTTEPISQNGDRITFSSEKEKIYYQGNLDQTEIPWDISLSYKLDGKEYSAEEIAGKSGELEIHFRVTENTDCPGTFFDDYALQASITLDTERCSNISAPDATTANVGSDKQLTYPILPGEGMDTIITAVVRDFEMSAVSVNGIHLNLNVEIDDKMDVSNFIGNTTDIENARHRIDELFNSIHNRSSITTPELQELRQQFNGLKIELDALTSKSNLITNSQGTILDGISGGSMTDLASQLRTYAGTLGEVQKFSLGSDFKSATAQVRNLNGEAQRLVFTFDELGRVRVKTSAVSAQMNILGDAIDSAGQKVKQMMGYWLSLSQVWGQIRQGISYITELNSAITNHIIVTGEATGSLREMGSAARAVANEVAGITTDIQNSATDWAALGYTAAESMELARQAAIYARVGFIDVDGATTSLTSSLQAFKDTLDTDDIGTAAEEIVDKFVLIANKYAVTSSELGEGLQRSAAALVAAGNDIDEAIALTTAGNTILQDSNAMSNALKVVSMRLRGTSATELEAAGEDIDGVIEDASKLYATVKELTKTEMSPEGISILTDTGTYKSTYQILTEIAEVWEDIGDLSQAALLEALAGKTRGSAVAALLQNPELLKEVYETSQDASGASAEAMEIALDSIEAHATRLQNTFQALWQNALNDDVIIMFVDLADAILSVVDKVGLLQAAFFAIGAKAGLNNVGRIEMVILIKYADRNKCSLGY